jgi:hypothetical protein
MYTFEMPPNTKIDFSDAHQDRSKKTLDDLLETAYDIVEASDPGAFNGRHLADQSGYALGTLNKRLGPIENVFLWAIEKSRDKKLKDFVNFIEHFDPHSSVQDYARLAVDKCFEGIGKQTPRVIRYYENKLLKRDGYTSDSLNFTDIFIKPYLKMVSENKTNTFRKMTHNETRMIFNLGRTLIERPFIYNDPIAGSEEHRSIIIESFVKLLGK